MAETVQSWEYQVGSIGSALHSPKDEELETLLNEWGEDGWEVISIIAPSGSTKIRIVAKRPLTVESRRRRSWPG
jgi:Domain of unknown function (DUF4177)